MRKSLSNKIFLKKKLFGFTMDPLKALELNIDDFKKVTIELTNIGEAISDENHVVILLNFLPKSFDAIKAAVEYGRDILSLDVVITTLSSKELEMKLGNKTMFSGADVLYIRGRNEKREFKNSKSQSRSASRNKKVYKCFNFHKEGHFKRECPDKKKRFREKNKENASTEAFIV